MNQNKTKQLNLLGLAMRAGFLISGDEFTEKAIKANQTHVVICASDSSEKTIARYQTFCQNHNVPLILDLTADEISQAIGRSRKLLAITNAGMAKTFISYRNGVTDHA